MFLQTMWKYSITYNAVTGKTTVPLTPKDINFKQGLFPGKGPKMDEKEP